MATRNATTSGLWSAAGTWDTPPVDGDAVVIAAGVTLTVDVDLGPTGLNWTTGVAGITITSAAVTPATLRFMDGYSGYLVLKTGTTSAGTNAAVLGRLLANSSGTWGQTTPLPFARKGVISLLGTANIDARYLDIALYGTEPTNKYVRTYGTTYSFTADAGTDECTAAAAHSWAANTPVRVSTAGTLPAGLSAGTLYYVRSPSGATLKLSTTASDVGLVDITDAGTDTHCVTTGRLTVSSIASDTVTLAATHAWANATAIMFTSSGTYPTGITANTMYYVIGTSGATLQLAAYSGGTALTLGTSWTGTLEAYIGGTATNTPVLAVLDNVTADTPWITTSDHNRVVLADAGPADYDQQRVTVSEITAATITLSANVDSSQYPNSSIYLSSRNVSVRSATTTTNIYIFTYQNATTRSGVFGCEIVLTAGTGTTFYGYGVYSGTGHTVSGTISGCNYGVGYGTGHTVSGTISGCSYGVGYGTGHTVSGTISGCSYGVAYGTGHTVSGTISGCSNGTYSGTGYTVSGTISGCSNGVYSGTGHTVSSTISGCSYGVDYGTGHTVSSTISGCSYGVAYGTGHTVSGTISGCSNGVYAGTGYTVSGTISGCSNGVYSGMVYIVMGSTIIGNTRDIYAPAQVIGYGARLQSATQVQYYTSATTNNSTRIFLYDVADSSNVPQAGQIAAWTGGGYCRSEAYVEGTHGTPPVSLTFIDRWTYEWSVQYNYVDYPIYAKEGQTIQVTLYVKQTELGMTQRPTVSICDPRYVFGHASEALASTTAADNMDWQTITVSHIATSSRPLVIRVSGRNPIGTAFTRVIVDSFDKTALLGICAA